MKIFIVDDEPNIRNAVKRIVREELPSVEAVDTGDGNEALRIVENLKPDLILLDVLMPGINGLEILKDLKNNKGKDISKIPVIMITGVSNREITRKAYEFGAIDYITKPFNEKVLLLKLKRFVK